MDKDTWKDFFKYIGIGLGAVISWFLAFVQLAEFFGAKDWFIAKWTKTLGFWKSAALVIAVVIIWLAFKNTYALARLRDEKQKQKTDQQEATLEEALLQNLESLYKKQEWGQVVSIGTSLSRPLWVSGRYIARIKIGKMVEEAAVKIDRLEPRVIALIDDLGWTNVIIGDYKKARKSIEHGLQLAQTHRLYYWWAKGLRHLAGIAKARKDYTTMKNYLEEALEVARQITDAYKKDEMIAGIYFGLANMHQEMKQYEEALKYSSEAQKIYTTYGDEERLAKTCSQAGLIYLHQGEFARAKDAFRKGLTLAQKLSRPDEVVHNQLGLAKVHFEEGDYEKAKQELEEAKQRVDHLAGLSSEVGEIQALLKRIESFAKKG
jgi:tetratricopeptide (TPR) repeat protein